MSSVPAGFLETAARIGARLCRDAVWAGEECNWLGDAMELVDGAWTVVHRACNPTLYDGTAGIALFLGRLHALTGERPFRSAAAGALRQALTHAAALGEAARAGVYAGQAGIAYVALDLGERWGDGSLVEQGLALLRAVAPPTAEPGPLDVISGSAGLAPLLLVTHTRYPDARLADAARAHGERLLQAARRAPEGWSWNTLETGGPALTGFSHGAAGIAWALLELHRATGDAHFRAAAEEGFRYEQHWYSPEQCNWPDLRGAVPDAGGADGGLSYALAWCHGAPGIGRSRLRAYQVLGEAAYLEQARAALQATAVTLQVGALADVPDCSLCHGVAGNAELFLYAADVLGDDGWRALPEQFAHWAAERYEAAGRPWPCGVLGGGETPGLMLGTAGVGHFYLRLARTADVPSPLLPFS